MIILDAERAAVDPAAAHQKRDYKPEQNVTTTCDIEPAISKNGKSREPVLRFLIPYGMRCQTKGDHKWYSEEADVDQHLRAVHRSFSRC